MNLDVQLITDGGARDATLTTERAESSYGLPVLVVDGIAYGPAEVGELVVLPDDADPADVRQAIAAGWRIQS